MRRWPGLSELGPLLDGDLHQNIPPKKGERKSSAVKGMRQDGHSQYRVGCECLIRESKPSVVPDGSTGAERETLRNSPNLRNEAGSSPANDAVPGRRSEGGPEKD